MTEQQASQPVLKRIVNKSAEYSHFIAILSIVLMFLASMVDVIANKLFLSPVTGCVELVEELMVVSVFLALGFTELNAGHLKVTIIPLLLPIKVRKVLRGFYYIFGILIIGILCWRSVALVSLYWEFGSIKQVYFYFPLLPTALLMVCGGAVFAISLIYSMLHPPTDYV